LEFNKFLWVFPYKNGIKSGFGRDLQFSKDHIELCGI
jgi:hypothetical protein